MTGVLVDVPTTSLTLVGPVAPRAVQILVGNLTPGVSLQVIGAAAGRSWTVFTGTVTAAQLFFVDVATPINAAITYSVVIDGVSVPAGSITVPYLVGECVLQSPDGRSVFPFAWHGADDPRDLHIRTATFDVPGRPDPVVRWDVAGGESGYLPMRTTRTVTDALRTHLRTRGPVLLVRTDGLQLDIPAAQYIAVTRAPRKTFGFDGTRLWTLEFEVIDNPEPGSPLRAVATPEDFDDVYTTTTADLFDTEWADATPETFDATDWTQH